MSNLSSTTNPTLDLQISNIENLFIFRDEMNVKKFILKHPSVVTFLIEGYSKIKQYFPDSPLYLEVFRDRETAEGDHLVVFISTDLKARVALKLLDKIDEEWWLENIDRAEGKLSINLEYQ